MTKPAWVAKVTTAGVRPLGRGQRWGTIALVAAIAVGVFCRGINLDLKPFWFDETATLLQMGGYSNEEVEAHLFAKTWAIGDLMQYQRPSPERGVADTLTGLAVKEPQLTPLYFVALRSWLAGAGPQDLGSLIAKTRAFSVLASLLVLPAMYGLAWELFRSRWLAGLAVALTAVCPVQVIYAQEARPIALWTLVIVGMNWALLRALRGDRGWAGSGWWLLYGVSLGLGLYTFLFTALVAIAHGGYVLSRDGWRWTGQKARAVAGYGGAMLLGFGAFVPWVQFALVPHRSVMANHMQATSLGRTGMALVRSVSLGYLDFSLNGESPKLLYLPFLGVVLLSLGLTGWVCWQFWCWFPRSVSLLPFWLSGAPVGIVLAYDLYKQTDYSGTPRYMIPGYLALTLMVAGVLGQLSLQGARLRLGRALLAGVLALGLASACVMAQSEFWWTKDHGNGDRQIAQFINQSRLAQVSQNLDKPPLLITDEYFGKVISLGHSLRPDTEVFFPSQRQDTPESLIWMGLQPKFELRPVFSFQSSAALLDTLKAQYRVEETAFSPALWRILPR
jgi:uncharacterized membrane protein